MMDRLTELKIKRQELDRQIQELDREKAEIDRQAWRIRVEKSNVEKAARLDLEKRSLEKFRDLIKPGVFVRVVGARTHKWKYVTELGETYSWSRKGGDPLFYGTSVFVKDKQPQFTRLTKGSKCQTLVAKVRECLTKEEFEIRFGKVLNLEE